MKRTDYIEWDDYFMKIAELSAQRSKDPITQVGCVIVDGTTRHILSIGYNGLPYGYNDDNFDWEKSENFLKNKNSYVVHAEANAILNSTSDLTGSVVYVTMFPCNECAKLLVQKRVSKIYYKDDRYLHKPAGQVAMSIFKTAGVVVEQMKGEAHE